MSEHVYFITLLLGLGTVLVIFAMRYFSAIEQAKARIAGDVDYRQLAEKSVAAQAGTAAALASMQASLAEVRARVETIEKILKEVE